MPDNLYRVGKTWYARVQVNGRRHKKSLKTASLVEAKVRRDKWLELLKQSAFYKQITSESGRPPSVQQRFQAEVPSRHAGAGDPKHQMSLESENAQLRELLADVMLDNQALRQLLSKKLQEP